MAKKRTSKKKAVAIQPVLSPYPITPIVWSKQNTDEAWSLLARRLVFSLAELDEDDFLILTSKRGNKYFQFAAQGAFGMRIEAASNQFLAEDCQLDSAADELLRSYGWAVPTYVRADVDVEPTEGSPNYFMDLDNPLPFEAIATLFVATMRNVYGIRHPSDLCYECFDTNNTEIRHPALGLLRRRKA